MQPPPPPKFFRCQDHVAMGNLILTWATGVDHMKINDANGRPLSWPVPRSFAEFEQQLHLGQVGPLDLDEFRDVLFVKAPDDDTLVIPLPSAAQIERGRAFRQANGAWLPPFFDAVYDGPRKSQVPTSDMFATQRIGEYCISHCC